MQKISAEYENFRKRNFAKRVAAWQLKKQLPMQTISPEAEHCRESRRGIAPNGLDLEQLPIGPPYTLLILIALLVLSIVTYLVAALFKMFWWILYKIEMKPFSVILCLSSISLISSISSISLRYCKFIFCSYHSSWLFSLWFSGKLLATPGISSTLSLERICFGSNSFF